MKDSKEAKSVHHKSDHMKETQEPVGEAHSFRDKPASIDFDISVLLDMGVHPVVDGHKLRFELHKWVLIDLVEEFIPIAEKLQKEFGYSDSETRDIYFGMINNVTTRTILRKLRDARIDSSSV